MNLFAVTAIGAGIGLILGGSIVFEPKEPYKLEIVIASAIRSTLVALLTAFSLSPWSAWYAGAGYGALYGVATGLVVFLAKGGFRSRSAPYVVPGAGVAGALTGVLIVALAF